jgi:hypothetical protein
MEQREYLNAPIVKLPIPQKGKDNSEPVKCSYNDLYVHKKPKDFSVRKLSLSSISGLFLLRTYYGHLFLPFRVYVLFAQFVCMETSRQCKVESKSESK